MNSRESGVAFLNRMRKQTMFYKPLDVSVHQGEIVPIAGPKCTGKTELALRIAAERCIDGMSQDSEKSSFDVLWISVGDIFPLQRFANILQSEFRAHKAQLYQNPQTEEQHFLAWMQKVTERCHVIECMNLSDLQTVLHELKLSSFFTLDPARVPLFIVDCGTNWIPQALQSLLLPLEKPSKFSSAASKHIFARTLQYTFPDVLNKANGSGVVIFRSIVGKAENKLANKPQKSSGNVQIMFQEDNQVIFQTRRSNPRPSYPCAQHQTDFESRKITYEISPEIGFTVLDQTTVINE